MLSFDDSILVGILEIQIKMKEKIGMLKISDFHRAIN